MNIEGISREHEPYSRADQEETEMNSKKPVTVALLGAGARGELNLATLARRHSDEIRFVAVAEPHDGRRERFKKLFSIPPENAFRDWRELAEKPRLADALINALPCRMHYESTIPALDLGYHVLLEKPMALTPGECVRLVDAAGERNLNLTIALQCRYNRIYSSVRELLDGGKIGTLMNIDCAENIGYWHFILSYVRGIHHHTSLSHSFVMAKGIHDVDLVTWFAGAPAAKVSSFGSLDFFNPDNAPAGAPERCTDGCPVEPSCEFSAIKQYVKPGKPDIPYSLLTGMSPGAVVDYVRNPRFRTMASIVVPEDLSIDERVKAVREGDYGKCVFRSDNNVVDHQTVSIEYENGVVASFSLSAFSLIWERSLDLHGTRGEIRSADFTGRLELRTFNPGKVSSKRIRYHGIIHGGGDEEILVRFARSIASRDDSLVLTSARDSLESHFICFAAEKSRLTGEVVRMEDLRRAAREEAQALVRGE